jgi:hypothetical protein
MGIEFLLTSEFLKGTIACIVTGVGGLSFLLLRHSVQLGILNTKMEALCERFDRVEELIRKLIME